MSTAWTARTVGAILALLGLAALAPFFFASGLMAPGWAVALLVAAWVALVVVAGVWFRRRPWWLVLLPVGAVLLWFGAMSAGEAWLGWTA